MLVQNTIIAPSGPFEVYQCLTGPSGVISKTLVMLQPGTVVTCEDSDIITGSQQYLRAFALFVITQAPNGTPPPPANAYYYSTGAHTIVPTPGMPSGFTSRYVVYAPTAPPPPPYACSLVSISSTGPAIIGTALIPGGTQLVANNGSVMPDQREGSSFILKAGSIFLVNNGTQGPYVFTDNDIPLNMLEDTR